MSTVLRLLARNVCHINVSSMMLVLEKQEGVIGSQAAHKGVSSTLQLKT